MPRGKKSAKAQESVKNASKPERQRSLASDILDILATVLPDEQNQIITEVLREIRFDRLDRVNISQAELTATQQHIASFDQAVHDGLTAVPPPPAD